MRSKAVVGNWKLNGSLAANGYTFVRTKFVQNIQINAVNGEIQVTYDGTVGIPQLGGNQTLYLVPTIAGAALAPGAQPNV